MPDLPWSHYQISRHLTSRGLECAAPDIRWKSPSIYPAPLLRNREARVPSRIHHAHVRPMAALPAAKPDPYCPLSTPRRHVAARRAPSRPGPIVFCALSRWWAATRSAAVGGQASQAGQALQALSSPAGGGHGPDRHNDGAPVSPAHGDATAVQGGPPTRGVCGGSHWAAAVAIAFSAARDQVSVVPRGGTSLHC